MENVGAVRAGYPSFWEIGFSFSKVRDDKWKLTLNLGKVCFYMEGRTEL